MPALLATPVFTAAFASSVGPAIYSVSIGGLLLQSTVIVASPAESLTLGRLAGIGAPPPPRDPPPPRRILARELGIAGDFGPRAYVAPTTGDCLAPTIPAGMPLLVDPDAEPRPGDVVLIWPRTDAFLAVRPGRMTMVEHGELEDVDADELERPLAPPGAWCFAKILAAPLPPREQWADDRDHRLHVAMTNPDVELRANLADAVSVDRVLGPVLLPGTPAHIAAAIDAWTRAGA